MLLPDHDLNMQNQLISMPAMTIRRAFWIFALLIILTTMADRILFIILPLYLIDLKFSATEIGLIFSLAGVIFALFRFVIGKVSDLQGRKNIMSLGLLTDSIATAFYPAVSTLAHFSIIKGIKDVAYNLTSTMEDALVGDSFPRRIRTRILTRLGTILPLGRALAALTGFVVVTYLSIIYGFYVAAASLFFAFLIFTIFYKEKRVKRITEFRFTTKNISKPLFIVSLIGLSNALLFTVAYYPGFFILADSLGLAEADLFLMFLLTYTISSFFTWQTEGWIKRHGKELVLGIGALSYGFFTMIYALAGDILVFYLALLGVAISFYVFRITYMNVLLDNTNRKARGEQVGFSKMISQIGTVAGPVTGGLLIDLVSLQSAFLVAGSFGILGFFLALWLKKL
jgi:MFS family permease